MVQAESRRSVFLMPRRSLSSHPLGCKDSDFFAQNKEKGWKNYFPRTYPTVLPWKNIGGIYVVIWSRSFVIFDFGNTVICPLYININIYIIVADFDSVFFRFWQMTMTKWPRHLKILIFLPSAFENRNGDVVPLQRQFERRNLRAHEKKFTGPRGRRIFIEMRQRKQFLILNS